MNEQELQAFLDGLMRESAAKNNVPQELVESVLRSADAEAAEEPDPKLPAAPDKEQPKAPADPPQKTHRVRDLTVGAVLLIFALLGLYTAVSGGVSLVRRLREKEDPRIPAVQERILPLVIADFPEFDDPDTLTDDQFLTAAVWTMVTNGRLGRYPENLGMRTVPAEDIAAAGNVCFGTSRRPEYRTIGFSGDIRFYYDKEQRSYLLPASPRLFTYVPQVQSLRDQDGAVTAEVAYYAEEPVWLSEKSELIKTMEFTLTGSGTAWQIRALRQLS